MIGDYLHREQSIGEARGLNRLQNLIDTHKSILEEKLGKTGTLPNQKTVIQDLPV